MLKRSEIEVAIKNMKDGKSPGVDNVTADEIKAAGKNGVDIFFKLFIRIWETEEIPEEWSKAVIVPIYKKHDKTDCNNFRGISLLCHAEKIFASIILQRIRNRTEEILSESQAGFRRGRSTIDQLFTMRLLTEKYAEYSKTVYICYIDFQKAFDSVWREGLWHIMNHLGYEKKIIRLLKALYKDTFSAVRVENELTEWFKTMVGVLQGCVLSPLLFCVFLEVIMARALDVEDIGAVISGNTINNLKFADDIGVITETSKNLQSLVNRVDAESKRFGMTINKTKTEVQCIPNEEQPLMINVNGVTLSQTKEFVYLGGKISDAVSSNADVERRISLATGIARSLGKIWDAKDISISTKIRIYNTLVLSVLLYNAETWTMKEELNRKLLVFEMAVLRRIAGKTRRERCKNDGIRKELGIVRNVKNHIRARRLQYFGHVVRMEESRTPNILLYGWVHGKRPVSRPRKRWLDNIREDCLIMGITLEEADHLARNRVLWSRAVYRLLERIDEQSMT